MTDEQKTFYWIVLGVRCYGLLKKGRYATVARIMNTAKKEGIYKESSSWRTAILLNYRIGEDI